MSVLQIITPEDVKLLTFDPVDPVARDQAAAILKEVRENGTAGLIDVAVRLRDIESADAKLYYSRDDLKVAFDNLPEGERNVLLRTAERIKKFASAQRAAVTEMNLAIPGGSAGHFIAPIEVAGCYAPGGRYPLPSSVLMTACTARAAGVRTVYVASPRPAAATIAAAYVADADGLLAVGGAQAIGAMAYGIAPLGGRCDVIVGPGNKWVTAAKSLVSGICAIDMLAGPSEVLVIADETCDPDVVAADLLAQAEHDTEARPILLSPSQTVIDQVNAQVTKRLASLSTRDTASVAVQKGFAVLCADISQCCQLANLLGPEHLEVHTANALDVSHSLNNYGAIFIGQISAEVLGDYGAGPNHVLPTSGTSRYSGGLSVFTFLRIRTYIHLTNKEDAQELVRDSVQLARMEGLEGHAQAAECRLTASSTDNQK